MTDYETTVVSRTQKGFKANIDEESIFVNEKDVVLLAASSFAQEEPVAILLANIQYVRRSRRCGGRYDREKMFQGLETLLKYFSIEELILQIRSMKWHEIVDVLTSVKPEKEIKEY